MPDIITSQDQREKERQRIATLNRIVNFTNVDSEPFEHSFDGVARTVPAGATLPMQWIIADLYATHLARKMLNRERKPGVKPMTPKRLFTDEEVAARKQPMISEVTAALRDIIPPAEQIARREAQVSAALTSVSPKTSAALDKQMLIEEIERRGVKVDRRRSKEDLAKQLVTLEMSPAVA